jgi:hypothetical protein
MSSAVALPTPSPGDAAGAPSPIWTRAKQLVTEHWSAIRWFIGILAVVIAAALFAIWNAKRAQQFSTEELVGIQKLLGFAIKSAREAQKTLTNPLQSLLHVNYALCFVNAGKHMVGGFETLQTLSPGIDVAELHQHLTQLQAQLLNKIRQQCTENALRSDLLMQGQGKEGGEGEMQVEREEE